MKKINLSKYRSKESGNVLFLILIAVALFAALSYAVTQSTRSGSNDANREKTLVSSSQVTQYPSGVRTAVLRMVLNGVSPEDLYFDPPSNFCAGASCIDDSDANTDDEKRAVFHPRGGGAPYQLAQPEIMASGVQGQWIFSDGWQISRIGTTGATAASNDLIAFLPGLQNGLCRRINEEYGITHQGANTDGDNIPLGVASVGTIPSVTTAAHNMIEAQAPGFNTVPIATIGTVNTSFQGQPYGCMDTDDTAGSGAAGTFNVYYHVMLER